VKLPKGYYQSEDVVAISRDLLGKILITNISGIITETEAYCGRNDKACHANNNRRTNRTEIMYHAGGSAYVYLCYGIHSLFNIVTNKEGLADAVLVRAVEPLEGIEEMLLRRNLQMAAPKLTAGPGAMSQALGITTKLYGTDLTGNKIWLEDRGIKVSEIISSARIGVSYAAEDALKPWRFTIKGNKWVSKTK